MEEQLLLSGAARTGLLIVICSLYAVLMLTAITIIIPIVNPTWASEKFEFGMNIATSVLGVLSLIGKGLCLSVPSESRARPPMTGAVIIEAIALGTLLVFTFGKDSLMKSQPGAFDDWELRANRGYLISLIPYAVVLLSQVGWILQMAFLRRVSTFGSQERLARGVERALVAGMLTIVWAIFIVLMLRGVSTAYFARSTAIAILCTGLMPLTWFLVEYSVVIFGVRRVKHGG